MIDKHHILHNRVEWTARPDSKALREAPSLVPSLDRRVHNEIHRETPAVPLLGYFALQRTLANFYPARTTVESMENLMDAIDISTRHPRTHEIEKHLADLAVWAIDLQRPFIQDWEKSQNVVYVDFGSNRHE